MPNTRDNPYIITPLDTTDITFQSILASASEWVNAGSSALQTPRPSTRIIQYYICSRGHKITAGHEAYLLNTVLCPKCLTKFLKRYIGTMKEVVKYETINPDGSNEHPEPTER